MWSNFNASVNTIDRNKEIFLIIIRISLPVVDESLIFKIRTKSVHLISFPAQFSSANRKRQDSFAWDMPWHVPSKRKLSITDFTYCAGISLQLQTALVKPARSNSTWQLPSAAQRDCRH
jgi:hypothetical protein